MNSRRWLAEADDKARMMSRSISVYIFRIRPEDCFGVKYSTCPALIHDLHVCDE